MITALNLNQLKEEALQRARIMVENGLYSRFRLSYQERVKKAQLGCIGELAFEKFLQNLGIPYQLDREGFENRNTDEFDFSINNKIIDVKVAKKSTRNNPNDSWTYGYPEEQYPERKDFVVIGWVDFDKNEVGFYGWLTGERIARFPVVEQNSYRGYRYLTPNHEFQWGEMNKNFGMLFHEIYRS
ncbi:MAG TPA: hypothetical protein VK057_10015 [Bacillota bacterium]|nr:hypothetical protein [Bacillota bacterium]